MPEMAFKHYVTGNKKVIRKDNDQNPLKLSDIRFLGSSRTHRSRRENNEENSVQFDLSKGLKTCIREFSTVLCQMNGVPAVKKLAYLNAFVKLIKDRDASEYDDISEDLFCCLRVGLVHEAMQVRAATFRVVRYLLKKEEHVIIINKLHYPYLLSRSIDLSYNEMEQIQVLRLIRTILILSPKNFSPVITRALVSIINADKEERKDKFNVFLAVVCELAVLNVNNLISCGGVRALARVATMKENSAVVETVLSVLIRLLINPETRSSVSLFCLAAPYCDIEAINGERIQEDWNVNGDRSNIPPSKIFQKYKDWEDRVLSSKYALLSILRSYPGVLHFCHPYENSGLKAIIDMLYLDKLKVRKAILELFYELLDIPLPMWTDEADVALEAVNPSRFRDSWKLADGFIVAEGMSLLPTLTSHCPNISELHSAFLIYVLLECGLHKALAETIVISDTFISVMSAVLLGMLLHFAHLLLPSEVYDLSLPLPNLLEHASAGSHQALEAVEILGKIHVMMRQKPTPASLFLEKIVLPQAWSATTKPKKKRQSSFRQWLKKLSPMPQMLKDSRVLSSKDALDWDWSVVLSIFRSRIDTLKVLEDSDHKVFLKKLIRYFKPTSNQYSRIDLSTNSNLVRKTTLACCELISCLLEVNPEGTQILLELVNDIADEIASISTSKSAHDCLFSPRRITTTCCQNYFLFIGQLSSTSLGSSLLEKFNLLVKLQNLATQTNHDCYVKLIISCLDYSKDEGNRKIFQTIIKDSSLESTRLYATQFLRVILRAQINIFNEWAIPLLIDQLRDSSKTVALAALETLNEVCEEPKYLEIVFQEFKEKFDLENWDKWLDNLGDLGYLFKIRFYSLTSAFKTIPSPAEELEKWIQVKGYAEHYAGIIESRIQNSFISRRKFHSVETTKWSNDNSILQKEVFLPPHLIGQLVQHECGTQLLLRRNVFQRFIRVIQRFLLEFGDKEAKNSKITKENRSIFEDISMMSEDLGNEEIFESNRLETIFDSENSSSLKRIHKNSGSNDSKRTTPEKSFIIDADSSFECNYNNLEGKLLQVKAALWILGHAGTSSTGLENLNNLGIIEILTDIAESCPIYSIRATAMYTLSLISTTQSGADILLNYNWSCVRYKRGENWPTINTLIINPQVNSSPVSLQKHNRSMSDGKPDMSEPIIRRTRIRSESAATELETKKFTFSEIGGTPSPVSSIQRLTQQDAEGYTRLRSLQNYRRPMYSHTSLEIHSLDERLSLRSLSELDSSYSWTGMQAVTSSIPHSSFLQQEDEDKESYYIGISLPKNLVVLFQDNLKLKPLLNLDDDKEVNMNPSIIEEELDKYNFNDHISICLICSRKKISDVNNDKLESDIKIRKQILRLTQHLANPVYCSRNALLRMRQNHPEIFKDCCMYSDIAAQLANNTYKVKARVFIQELFLDSPFSELFQEPIEFLKINVNGYENIEKLNFHSEAIILENENSTDSNINHMKFKNFQCEKVLNNIEISNKSPVNKNNQSKSNSPIYHTDKINETI